MPLRCRGLTRKLLAFTRAGAKSGSGRVRVVIDSVPLAKAYGGGFGLRLLIYQVPAAPHRQAEPD